MTDDPAVIQARYDYLRHFNKQPTGRAWNDVMELVLFGIWDAKELDKRVDAAIAEKANSC
jgi:hypothetical protein